MNIVNGNSYVLKFAARKIDGYSAPLKILIVSSDGNELASAKIEGFDSEWKYYQTNITASDNASKAHREISCDGTGTIYLDMISLMPVKTWKDHGLRVDLANALDSIHPELLRFPGGCWVERDDFEHMNHWKNTIGNIDMRTPLWNIWGYNATHGLGFHEYLQLAKDLGAEPLFCINADISNKEVVPLDQMGQWIKDALDAIEYANGYETSVWGSIRSKNGHPVVFESFKNDFMPLPQSEIYVNNNLKQYPGW
jgi:alpha-L-arabinofuranosidase